MSTSQKCSEFVSAPKGEIQLHLKTEQLPNLRTDNLLNNTNGLKEASWCWFQKKREASLCTGVEPIRH